MKKYTTPNMTVRLFSNITETTDASLPNQPYVTGLGNIEEQNRAQVRMEQMTEVTQFSF